LRHPRSSVCALALRQVALGHYSRRHLSAEFISNLVGRKNRARHQLPVHDLIGAPQREPVNSFRRVTVRGRQRLEALVYDHAVNSAAAEAKADNECNEYSERHPSSRCKFRAGRTHSRDSRKSATEAAAIFFSKNTRKLSPLHEEMET
jgi:hypothetical protein